MAESDERPESPAPQKCPRCEGALAFYLRTLPESETVPVHRIYRCETCSHFEWVAEPPGKRT